MQQCSSPDTKSSSCSHASSYPLPPTPRRPNAPTPSGAPSTPSPRNPPSGPRPNGPTGVVDFARRQATTAGGWQRRALRSSVTKGCEVSSPWKYELRLPASRRNDRGVGGADELTWLTPLRPGGGRVAVSAAGCTPRSAADVVDDVPQPATVAVAVGCTGHDSSPPSGPRIIKSQLPNRLRWEGWFRP